jgi:hypothetical protein
MNPGAVFRYLLVEPLPELGIAGNLSENKKDDSQNRKHPHERPLGCLSTRVDFLVGDELAALLVVIGQALALVLRNVRDIGNTDDFERPVIERVLCNLRTEVTTVVVDDERSCHR